MRKNVSLMVAALVICCSHFSMEGAAAQPNILVILTDDLGYHDLSCQGVADFQTPNIDRLAAVGVRLTEGYVTAPQCGPSRAGLLTGMSQSRFGFTDNGNDRGLPPSDIVQTLPEQLKQQGYTTGIIGKWHIGFVEDEEKGHITLPGNHPWERGFDYVLTHNGGMAHFFPYRNDGMKWMTERKREYRLEQKMENQKTSIFLDGLPADTYLTDYFSQQAADYVIRNQDKPWFLYLSYNAPHTPMVAKKNKLAKYSHIQDRNRRHLAAMMDSLDEGIGRVLEALEKTGQTRETLVFFLSDNGGPTDKNGSRNDPFSGFKGDVFEGGIRVPFLVSWPGTLAPGRVLDGPVISLDILPTALAAAGVEKVPEIHEGKNLLPWLKDGKDCPNEVLFWSWRGNHHAIRMGTLKEVRNGRPGKTMAGTDIPAHNFVDLSVNPTELGGEHRLKSPEKQQLLSCRLDAWLKQLAEDAEKLAPGQRGVNDHE